MIQLYRPGAGPVHRLPAGVKLALFTALALVISALVHSGEVAVAVLLVVCALFFVARLPLWVLAGELWRLRWMVVVIGAALSILVSPLDAGIAVSRISSLLLLASLLTLTTRMGDLLDVLRRVLAPARRLGADPEVVALAVSLTITMIPVVAGFMSQIVDAQRARGLRAGMRGVVPLLVRTLRHADIVGEALAARGLVGAR